MPDPGPAEATEPTELTEPGSETTRSWKPVVLLADGEREPPADLSDCAAQCAWAAVSALWHPAILARVERLPRIEDAEQPTPPLAGEIRLVAGGSAERLPSGYRTQAEDSGAALVEAGDEEDRFALAARALARVDPAASLEEAGSDGQKVALDFLALGTARWLLRLLTVGMGHLDALDLESLNREVLTGARAWRAADFATATNRLRAAFELLTQARERFYPVDAYLVDLCLLDPSTQLADLADTVAARTTLSLVAPARVIELMAERDPDRLTAIRQAVNDGWLDVVGGAYDEVDEPLLPLESILWQFRRAGEVYRAHIEGRTVETLVRRRFALYPQLPQIAKRFGCRFGFHLALDDGKFPVPVEAKRLWESPDGTNLEALLRPPLAADRMSSAVHLPWRLARSMKDDHVATVALVHWPSPLAEWYRDLRRMAAHSPVLARWVTLSDFFHLTDRPFESFRPRLDEYQTPYLAQAASRGETAPMSRRATHARLRARADGMSWLIALASALQEGNATGPEETTVHAGEKAEPPQPTDANMSLSSIEEDLETGRFDAALAALERDEPVRAQALAPLVVGTGKNGRPGYLIFNPLGVSRHARVLLPDASPDIRPEGPLRASQFTEEGVWGVVDLAANGFAWVPRETSFDQPAAASGALGVRKRTLFNQVMEVEIDEKTGGLRGVRAAGEPSARLGQQLLMTGLADRDGKPATTQMQAEAFEVEYGGPALVQAVATGKLIDPQSRRALATFRQRYRLWTGRPTLEIDVTLSDLDPDWLEHTARADPWQRFLSCRWAWADAEAGLRRVNLLAAEPTEAERPETPEAFEIFTRRQKTALLFGGLAYHRRHGPRMLDTLLLAGKEAQRSFQLAVALDIDHAFHAAADFVAPVYVVPTDTGPPRAGPAGWFFQLDSRAVAVTRVSFRGRSGDGRGWGLVFHLLETAGRAARCRLRLYRDPVWARQTDFQDELIVDLPVEDDYVSIDLTPHELARVDVTLG